MLIRLVFTEIQRFKNVKIYKEMYGIPTPCQTASGCHTFLCKFWHFQMAVSQWKLAWLTPNLGILWISVSSFWLSIVSNPIIYRLVPRPSRFETRQLPQSSWENILWVTSNESSFWHSQFAQSICIVEFVDKDEKQKGEESLLSMSEFQNFLSYSCKIITASWTRIVRYFRTMVHHTLYWA